MPPINAHADIIIQLSQRCKVCSESSSTDCAFVQARLSHRISTKIAFTGSCITLLLDPVQIRIIGYICPFQVSIQKIVMYNKTCLKRPLSKRPKNVFKTNYGLMQVKSIAEYSKGSILQYFRHSKSYLLS